MQTPFPDGPAMSAPLPQTPPMSAPLPQTPPMAAQAPLPQTPPMAAQAPPVPWPTVPGDLWKRFKDSCNGERTRVFTTRTWWILALIMLLLTTLSATAFAASFTYGWDYAVEGSYSDEAVGLAQSVYTLAPANSYLFPLLLGALSVTTQYRHRTLGSTFVWSGSRNLVLAGKVAVQSLMGAAMGLAALLLSVLVGVLFFSLSGMPTGLAEVSTWLMFIRVIVVMAVWAAIGVGVGVLVRSQVAAIVVLVGFVQFVEPVISVAGALFEPLGALVPYLPGAASRSFVGGSGYSMYDLSTMFYESASWWAGGLAFVGFAAVLVTIGAQTRWRADVP